MGDRQDLDGGNGLEVFSQVGYGHLQGLGIALYALDLDQKIRLVQGLLMGEEGAENIEAAPDKSVD